MPWIGLELSEKKKEELDNILEGAGKYIEGRRKVHVKVIFLNELFAVLIAVIYMEVLDASSVEFEHTSRTRRLPGLPLGSGKILEEQWLEGKADSETLRCL